MSCTLIFNRHTESLNNRDQIRLSLKVFVPPSFCEASLAIFQGPALCPSPKSTQIRSHRMPEYYPSDSDWHNIRLWIWGRLGGGRGGLNLI